MDTQYMVGNIKTVEMAGIEVPFREWNDFQVLTLSDIDKIHNRADGSAKRCFLSNKDRYEEDIDYYKCDHIAAKEYFHIIAPNGLYLLTMGGYLHLLKSWDDDISWKMYRYIINVIIKDINVFDIAINNR